jgi:thiamine biosynthesis lipoprotein
MRYGSRIRGHVMDPASGYPADRLLQVTVVAETGIGADALSTAMLVAGKRLDGAKQVYLS